MQRINPKIALRGFKPGARGAGHVLGELESAVMEVLWTKPEQTVNEVEERLLRKAGDCPHNGLDYAGSNVSQGLPDSREASQSFRLFAAIHAQ